MARGLLFCAGGKGCAGPPHGAGRRRAERNGSGGGPYRSGTRQTIKADGSAVVRVYYERKSYDVTFTYGTFRSAELPDIVYTIKYGGTAYAPALALQGYTFEGFEGFTADAQSGDRRRGRQDRREAVLRPRTLRPPV